MRLLDQRKHRFFRSFQIVQIQAPNPTKVSQGHGYEFSRRLMFPPLELNQKDSLQSASEGEFFPSLYSFS